MISSWDGTKSFPMSLCLCFAMTDGPMAPPKGFEEEQELDPAICPKSQGKTDHPHLMGPIRSLTVLVFVKRLVMVV